MILGIQKKVLIIGAFVIAAGWMYLNGSASPFSEGAESGSACQMTVHADVLNVRAAPDGGADVVEKFKQDAELGAMPVVQNGFRQLSEGRWASEEFLKPVGGAVCG